VQDFRKLKVWEKSHQLTLELFKITTQITPEHKFLINQTRRATTSISSNLAEGCGRGSNADFKRFVQMAMGSACELEYLLMLLRDLELIPEIQYKNFNILLIEIKRMLSTLIKKLRADS
jgi:four helix bundle protein